MAVTTNCAASNIAGAAWKRMAGPISDVNGDLHLTYYVKLMERSSKTLARFAAHQLSFIRGILVSGFWSSNAQLRDVALAEGIFVNGRAMLTAVRPANWWNFSGR